MFKLAEARNWLPEQIMRLTPWQVNAILGVKKPRKLMTEDELAAYLERFSGQ